MVEIREFDDVSGPELARAWSALEAAGACPSLFVSRAWLDVWSREFARDSVPAMLVGYDAGSPVGMAPLFVAGGARAEFPVNFLALRAEFLITEGHDDDFVSAALRHLRGSGRSLLLRNLPEDSLSLSALRRCARQAGYLMARRESRLTPYIDTTGTWDDYLACIPKKRVTRWQRRVRKLEKQPGMNVVRYDDATDVGSLVDALVDVDSRSWREDRGTSIRGRGLSTFYRELCGALSALGWLRPLWIDHDGRMTAFVLGVVHGGAYYALKTAYDESYSNLSPGTCLFYEVVRDAFQSGLSRVDFLGEPARWKSEWATGHRAHADVHLDPATPAGLVKHLMRSRVRRFARKALQRE